jgi:hypothetical protein
MQKLFFIMAALTVFLCSCPGEAIGGAGAGADFDPSQYYTKSDIDQMLVNYALKSELNGSLRFLRRINDGHAEFTISANTITNGILIMSTGITENKSSSQLGITYRIDRNGSTYYEKVSHLVPGQGESWCLARWIDNGDWTVDNDFLVYVYCVSGSMEGIQCCVYGY